MRKVKESYPPLIKEGQLNWKWVNRTVLMVTTRIGTREILYVLIMGIAASFSFIKIIVFASYLNPTEMGYYSIAITIASYFIFLQFGLMSGLNRELPVRLGAKENEFSAQLVGETTLSVLVLQLIGVAIFFFIVSIVSFEDFYKKTALILGAILSFFGVFGQIINLRLRAEQRVLSFSLFQLVNVLGVLGIGILAIKIWGYKGAIFAHIIFNIFGYIIVSKLFLTPVNYLYFKIKEIFYLMRIGLPLMGAGVLLNFQASMDRLFLLKYRLVEEIGVYQIGVLPLTMGIMTSSLIGQYVGPKLLFRYGEGESPKFVFYRSFLISLITIGGLLLIWPFFSLIINYVVNRWLPHYQPSLPLMTIFYLGGVFAAANIGVLFSAVNRQVISFYISGAVVFTCFIGNILVTYFNLAVKWYALVSVFGQILFFILTTVISIYIIQNPKIGCKLPNPAK